MDSYTITRPDAEARAEILAALPRIADLPEALREPVLTAWATTWKSSTHARLADAPFTAGSTYPLVRHVSEVAEAGLVLIDLAARLWDITVSREHMLAILLLHDVDKPLLYERRDGVVVTTSVYDRIPHGVLGALLLAELGMEETIVVAVSTHAVNAPFRGDGPYELLLHHADMLCADRAMQVSGLTPFFTGRH